MSEESKRAHQFTGKTVTLGGHNDQYTVGDVIGRTPRGDWKIEITSVSTGETIQTDLEAVTEALKEADRAERDSGAPQADPSGVAGEPSTPAIGLPTSRTGK